MARSRSARSGTMSLGSHLREARRRLTWSAIAVLVGSVGGWFASDALLGWLSAPVSNLSRSNHQVVLNFTGLSSAFDLRIQLAVTVGVVVASPVWLYQFFAFIVPALHRKERGYLFGFAGATAPLFIAGALAGCLVVPHIVQLMTSFAPIGTTSILDAQDYLNFILKLVILTGVAFVLPVALVLLNFLGVLRGRTILRGWRLAVLAITLFTAIATPSADVVSMLLLAAPMVFLYLAACAVSLLHDRRTDARLSEFVPELAMEG